MQNSAPTHFCRCKPFSCPGCPGICFFVYLSNPKPGHITGGSVWGARRSDRAGSGKIGCQQNFSPRKQRSSVPSKASKKRRFNVSSEARNSEFLCKPTEEQNQRLTTGLSPIYHRFITGTTNALCPGFRPVERRLFVSINPFHARYDREETFYLYKLYIIQCDLSNPKPGHTMGRSGRSGARRCGGTGRGWVGRDAVASIRPRDNPPCCPQAKQQNVLNVSSEARTV